MQRCKQCAQSFEITNDDMSFYEKVSPIIKEKKYLIPPPSLCLSCREQQKFSFRNERVLYNSECSACLKKMVSLYPKESKYIIYCPDCWWGNAYDPLKYGQNYDFDKSFFEQYQELNIRVPKLAIQNAKSINCDYTNYSAENKNCYLVVGSLGCENCYYGYRIFYSKDVVDCYDLYKCELCYECLESDNLYNCTYCQRCQNSNDLEYCDDCIGCEFCFGSTRLRNKNYYIFNKRYSKEKYASMIKEIKRDKDKYIYEIKGLKERTPHRAVSIINSENCTGDRLMNCKNCTNSYITKNSEFCKNVSWGENNKDSNDAYFVDNCELQYDSLNLEKNYQVLFGNLVWYCSESYYVSSCFNSSNLFGCSGMKKHQYCILNKQYSKEEYEDLVPKIIDHMRSKDEWGKFFPNTISPFAYNESIAQEHFPMSENDVVRAKWKWKEMQRSLPSVQKIIPAEKLPNSITQIPDKILNWAISCEKTERPFKIQKDELEFYRKMQIPIPHCHPDERHAKRMSQVNPRQLFDRKCQKCKNDIQTTYAPERPEIVYCEECYLKEVY